MDVNTNTTISLSDTNQQSWDGKMQDLLYVKEYREPLFSTEMSEDISEDQRKILQCQACGFIRQWIGTNVLNHIIHEIYAHTL